MQATRKRYSRLDLPQALSTRRGTVLAGIGCAVLAGALLLVAMVRYRDSLEANQRPMTVLVATQRIPKNTPGDVIASQALFRATQINAKQVSVGAVGDAAAIRGKVAARDIFPGEQLTAADFAGGGLPAELAPTERATVLSLDSQHGMVGSLQDGDHVDVYGSILVQGNLGRPDPVERLLARDVPVLHAGTSGSGGSALAGGTTTTASNVTLGLSDQQVGVLTYAQDYGKVWLVLRGADATNTSVPSPITVQTFMLGAWPVVVGGGQ